VDRIRNGTLYFYVERQEFTVDRQRLTSAAFEHKHDKNRKIGVILELICVKLRLSTVQFSVWILLYSSGYDVIKETKYICVIYVFC
jgi:hypothetical protein